MNFIKSFFFFSIFFFFNGFAVDFSKGYISVDLSHDSSFSNKTTSSRPSYQLQGSNFGRHTVWQSNDATASFVLTAKSPNSRHYFYDSWQPEGEPEKKKRLRQEKKVNKSHVSKSVVMSRFFEGLSDVIRKTHKKCVAKRKKMVVVQEFEKFQGKLKRDQNFFSNRVDEIEQYQYSFAASKNNVDFQADRYEQRRSAIQEAIENNFEIGYMNYEVNSTTRRLLERKGIDPISFASCLGNSIQQQIHSEFVSVLNSSANLLSSDCIDQIDTDWFATVGDCSVLGCQVNAACQYSLAHKLSDICYGIYKLADNCVVLGQKVCGLAKEGIETFYEEFHEQLKHAFLFSKNLFTQAAVSTVRICDSAYVRPFRSFVQLAYLVRNNPELVAMQVLKGMCEGVDLLLAEADLLGNLLTNPFSVKSIKSIIYFEKEYAIPFRTIVFEMARRFNNLPTREKIEEIIALALQLGTTKYLKFLAKKVVEGATLAGGTFVADLVLAEELVFAADGGIAISIPSAVGAAVPVASTIGVAAEAAAGISFAIADAA